MNDKPTTRSQDIVVALVGVAGLAIAMLGFMLAFAAHFNNKLANLEEKVAQQCVPREVYDHHNHGGSVPPEGP